MQRIPLSRLVALLRALGIILAIGAPIRSQAQTLRDYIRRYDGGPALSYYNISGWHIDQRDGDSIPIDAHYGGISALYSFYAPVVELGGGTTAGISPGINLGAAYSPAARAVLVDADVPLMAMLRHGLGSSLADSSGFGIGLGIGYRFFLIGTSIGDHQFLFCGTQGPAASLEATFAPSESSSLKLRLLGTLPIGIVLAPDDGLLTSDFTGTVDFTAVTLSLSWVQRF